MDSNLATPLIIAGGSAMLAITALVWSHRGFAVLEERFVSLEGRFDSLENRSAPQDSPFASIELRLGKLQADMKDLSRRMTALAIDIALVKDKIGRSRLSECRTVKKYNSSYSQLLSGDRLALTARVC